MHDIYRAWSYHDAALYHHGIKGQKWGVRRGPPYPIEDKTMPKGTRLNNVSVYQRNPKDRWMYTYNPDDKWDASVYKGPFSVYLMQMKGREVLEHQYETIKDLRMPTSKERMDEFVKIYKRTKFTSARELSEHQIILERYRIGSEASRTVNMRNLKTEADYKAAYEVFNHLMENAWKYNITRQYCKVMSKKYDAMVDDNNQTVYNHAHDPVIIFRVNEALKEIGDARLIPMSEVAENYKKIEAEMARKGEHILL